MTRTRRKYRRPPRTDRQRMVAPCLVSCAIESLKRARADLRAVGCQQAYRKVCRALKSAEGALRNAEAHSPLLNPEAQ